MIRINLLPHREARRQAGQRRQGVLLGGALTAGVLLCGVIHVSMASRIASHRSQIARAEQQLKQLEETLQRVETFRAEQSEIQSKLAVIDNLELARQGPVRILDEIATRIPKRMWLTKLSLKEGILQMEGMSLDAEIVAAFLKSLEESDLVSNVELQETTLQEVDGLKLNSFKLRSNYPWMPPTSPAPAGGTPTRRS